MASQHDSELGERNHGIPRGHRGNSSSEQTLGQLLAEVGLQEVFYNPHRDPEEWIINLGNLHRMTMFDLQREIVEEVAKIKQTETVDAAQLSKIRTTISSYGKLLLKRRVELEGHSGLLSVGDSFFDSRLGANGDIRGKGWGQSIS